MGADIERESGENFPDPSFLGDIFQTTFENRKLL